VAAIETAASTDGIRWRTTALIVAGICLGTALGVRDVRTVFFDDAAITLRFAARISSGDGWTYNDGDRTNGASAPLYTLLLTGLHLVGMNLVSAAKLVGIASYAATFGLAAWIADRLGGATTAVAALVLLAASGHYRLLALSGMESSFAAALGLTAVLCVLTRREWLAGVIAGLAVVNKLDAGILAAALAVAVIVVERRLPWRMIAAALAVFAPWAVFAQLYFGSIVPFSAVQKLTVQARVSPQDPLWMVKSLYANHETVVAVLAALSVVVLASMIRQRRQAAAAGLAALLLWPLAHLLVFSLVHTADARTWYLTVVIPPMVIAASVTIGASARFIQAKGPLLPRICVAGLVGAMATAALVQHMPEWRQAVSVLAHGHQMDPYETFEQTRRDAGVYLGQVIRPGEVLRTCYGWPQFGALQATIAETCPLSTRKPVASPSWQVDAFGVEQDAGFKPPGGFHIDRKFSSPFGVTYVLRADE
jgi:hypothetical protein